MSVFTWVRGKHGTWSARRNWQNYAVPTATDDADISGGSPDVRYAIEVKGIVSNADLTGNAALRFVLAGSSTVETDIDLGGQSYLTVLNSLVTVGGATSVPVITVSANAQSGARLETGTLNAQFVTLTGTHGKHAQLTVDAPASFGSGSDISQHVSLLQDSRIEFAGTTQFTSLSGSLSLSGSKALIADAGISAASNSALRDLSAIGGQLLLDQGAVVALTGRLVIQSGADVEVSHGSALAAQGALTNKGTIILREGSVQVRSALVNEGAVSIYGSGDVRHVDVAGRIYNNGSLEFYSTSEEIGSTIAGKGKVSLGAGATLTLDGAVSRTQAFSLQQNNSLVLNDAEHFAGTVRGFGRGDSFVFSDFAADTTFSYAENAGGKAGVLTVSDGTHDARIFLGGSYTSADFTLSAHAGGGVTIASST